ncbi:VOC family protein [Kiritimatiellaeota bacterium B1221]|nr:VOC family protein [Kiritimatiellaeota bacterium B1221]
MNKHEKLNYVEFPAKDLGKAKRFFEKVFAWEFVDYGPAYTAFSDQGLDGGFYKSDQVVSAEKGSALLVFFSDDLETTQSKIEEAGGTISQAIFSFPGGRRFHFLDPNGNEYAVWGELAERMK